MTTGDLAETLQDQWVRVGDFDVHLLASRYPVEGSLAVVYLAGFIVGGHSAVPLTAELARYYRIYAPDLPGYGASTKPPHTLSQAEQADVIAAMLDALGIDSVALLANSFAAQIAVEFAVRHPQRLQRLVLMGPAVDPRARNPFRQLVRFILNSRHEDAIVPGMVSDYFAAGPWRIIQTARYALRDRMEKKLPRVQAPTLVIRGSEDMIVPRRWAEQVVGLLPNGRLLEIEGYAHGPERVGVPVLAPVIRDFLDEA